MPPRKNIELQGIDKKRAAARMRGPSSSRSDIPVDARSEWAEGPKSFESLDTSELIRNLDEQGPRAEILRRVSVNAAPIRSAIKESGLSVRKNADLDGYRSYETNIRQLRDTIVAIAMAQNPHTADDAEKVFKILNRIDAYHKRIIDDAQNKGIGVTALEPKQSDETLSMSGSATGRMGNTFVPVDLKVVSIGGSSNETKQEEPEVLPMADIMKRTPEQNISPESPEGLRARLQESLARVRKATSDAHGGNPLAVVNLVGTREFFAAYNSAKALLDGHKNGQLNGDETNALPTVTASIAELERMSFEIAKSVTSSETTPQTTATKPPEAVTVSPAPKINIVIENARNAATPKSPERTPELAALKEKYDTYKAAKEAYEKAIDKHYGAYRSNTGPFAERLGRGMRKFFGMGPKHDSLTPLYLAMNDARVDFSRSRFEAMDARIKARVAKGGVNANALATWNEGLKRREIGRTIRRSSEGFIKRQYLALSPAQQSAVDAAMVRTEGEVRKDERRTTYAQFAVGALSGALMVWKTKSAVMTGGISLVAGAFGVATGNMVGETVEWWKNRKIEKMKDRFDTESKKRGATVDYDSIGDYDETLRNRTRKIIATEESRNTQVKAARVAGAVAGGVIAGTFANEFDLGGKAIDDHVVTSPESTPKGDFNIPVPDHELRPIPDSMPDGVDGTNVVPQPDGVVEKGGMYHMVKGDNPWDLVEEKHFSEKFDAMTKTERDVVIDSAMDRLRADEALRERIFPGYSGTTFTDMQIGQDVNLKEYEKLIDEQLAKGGHGAEKLSLLSDSETKAAALPEIESENPEPGEGVEEDGDIYENEKPSENIEDRRTPEKSAEPDQAFRNLNAETSVSAADIARERQTLYATLGDNGPKGGFLFSLFGPAHTSAHEYLANQTLDKVTELSAQRQEYVAMIASQNNVDQTALQNWTNYMNQLKADIANRPPNMTFKEYVDVVAEELARHNKQA